MADGLAQFQLQNEISPIILMGGIAASSPGGVMKISDLIENGLDIGYTYDDYFAHFKPVAGGTLANWGIAEYPFASLVMAANAVIQEANAVSMLMFCPAQTDSGRNFLARSQIITNLQNQIQTHINLGGTFTVVTPAYTYSNCLLRLIRDVSPPSDKQVQYLWQWDFYQPLITTAGAAAALGVFNNKAQLGLPTLPTWNSQ
jgi:hypothetical protein